ncbi:MAG: hypothetical protein CL677_01600 [Bdellovibrionaceae bacterium]|nr:hypothetical protein [Pseudobdellovibrionaceae bacterium]
MPSKPKKNQVFRSGDAISVLGVLCVVCYIFVYVLANNTGDRDLESAKIDMESLSAQLMAAGMKSLPGQGISRGLASVENSGNPIQWVQDWNQVGSEGKIGKDPWGEPFHYLVVKESANKAKYIVIISGGPNKLMETPVEQLVGSKSSAKLSLDYVGDDFGLVRAVP